MSALHRALDFASSDAREFIAPEPQAPDYAEFQETAEALLQAKSSRLVYEAKEERSKARETYGHIKRVVVAGGLTPEGKAALRIMKSAPIVSVPEAVAKVPNTNREPEILQLRPTFAGMSIDLKALWRKWRAK